MSVNPGFAAQKFIGNAVNKVKELKMLIEQKGAHALIEVDGGINAETGRLVADACKPRSEPSLCRHHISSPP